MGFSRLIMRAIVIMTIALVFFSCKKQIAEDGVNYTVYTISSHKSNYGIKKVNGHKIEGKAKFDSSCEYELTENIGQINKLVGLSSGTNHHNNSVRIGWEYADGLFKLYAYWYINGERAVEEYITSVDANEPFDFYVEITDDEYKISINEYDWSVVHDIDRKNSYLLYPYFGGKAKFPGSIHGDKECKIYLTIL